MAATCISHISSSSSIQRCGSVAARLLPQQRVAGKRQQRAAVVTASLDSPTITAVTQQAVAYVAVLGGEAAFTGSTTDASTPGRPTVSETLIGAGGTLVAVALVQQQGFVSAAGCAVGALTAAAMMTAMIQRVQKTPYNPADWPGAKAWPATMCLISFFSLAVFFQALTAALN